MINGIRISKSNTGFSLLDDASDLQRRVGQNARDLKRIHRTDFWLEDEHVNQAMSILKKTHLDIDGFQDVCVMETGMAKSMKIPWIQVFNSKGNHWLTATTIGCSRGVIKIYDSLYRQVPKSVLQLLFKLTSWPSHELLTIEMPRFQKQRNSNDCGLFSIACMMSLCNGQDPANAKYDLRYLRSHLVDCLEKKFLKEFPKYMGHVDKLGQVKLRYFICDMNPVIIEYDIETSVCKICLKVL